MNILGKIAQAVVRVLPDRDQDELRESHRYIGQPIDRLDGREKVTGEARFSAEYPIEGLVHAALVFSTVPKGVMTSIDTSAAERSAGVIRVITHLNAPAMAVPEPLDTQSEPSSGTTFVKILNTDRVSWNGQPIAVVVAETEEQAEDAASLVTVTYAREPAVTSFDEAIGNARTPKDVLGESPELTKGDVDAALASAPHAVDITFSTPPYNHNAIEPHATIAVWEDDDHVTVYDTSQFTVGTAGSLSQAFGMKREQVRLLAPYVGGGFGGKGGIWPNTQLCVMAARVVGRPVRLALSRAGVFRIVGGRTPSRQRVAVAADEAGHFTAFIHEGVTAQSTDNHFPEQFSFPPRHLYEMGSYRIGQKVTEVSRVANTFMRAPGESIGTFAVESAIDALSYALKMDPIELRARNEPAADPVSGHPFSSRFMREAYRLGADRFRWHERPAEIRSQRHGDWLVGQGVATGTYPVYRLVTAARVRLRADGTALVQSSCQEMGMGTVTAQMQHAAERLGLPLEQVSFEYGDSTLPAASVAGGSSQTISIVLAVHEAVDDLVRQLLSLAKRSPESVLASATPDSVQATKGGLFLKDQPAVGESYTAILHRAGSDFVETEARTRSPLEMMKYSMHSYAAQFCEVGVHAHTAEIRVRRWVGAFDTGRIINPKMAVSQFRGGIIMGIGMALTEETIFDDRTGRIVNPTLAEYHLPVQADVPHIDIVYTDAADPHTPLGAHGIGEIGITGVAAAIANAVHHATGVRVTGLPITLDKLL